MDQFNRELKTNLDEIQPAIERGLETASQSLTDAIAAATGEMKSSLNEAQNNMQSTLKDASEGLTTAIKAATDGMNTTLTNTQDKMQNLIGDIDQVTQKSHEANSKFISSINETVGKLEEHQKQQKDSLDQFNRELKTNLDEIQPAIERGLETASQSLTDAIAAATGEMKSSLNEAQNNMQSTLKDASEGLTTAIKAATDGMNTTLTNTQDKMQNLIGDINQVTQKSHEANSKFISAINETVGQLEEHQKQQKDSLDQFNRELKTNLDEIQPAIERGLEAASQSLTDAIDTAASRMNDTLNQTQTAMSTIIDDISTQVLNNLTIVLADFNNQTNNHLDRMNQELTATGNLAAGLMQNTATHLENTLGNIHTTIQESSTVLQQELQDFREAYQINLTDFFDKQNAAFEQTLGRQIEGLQGIITELENQFKQMTTAQTELHGAQKTINSQLESIGTHIQPTYEGLLNQMLAITERLNQGHQHFQSGINGVTEQMQELHNKLHQICKDLPTEFEEKFKLLNDTYINRFNQTEENFTALLNQMRTTAAVVITAHNNIQQ